ncbi:hypothetical protein GVN20_28915 [Runella sp. CRIBMP]|uniref:hypothetical protein n=1 Tax=Runella sp. CRIBMP TaxID=2683261 RepID=UPI001411F1FD|nr:hypothetical protein [Runella sp. CRIBMP]NBB23407.1 hypothetical protein [Runella sp. CRIBMP]
MVKLFEDKERTNLNYAKHQHDSYDFYDNSAIEDFVKARNMLNDWFARYPNSGKWQLKRDFQSQFDSAFFELFIHELFFQQGFILTPHPIVPNSTKNPDFLARKGDLEIYLEAKIATDESKEEKSLRNKHNAIYDLIEKIHCPDYWVSVREITFLSSNQAKLNLLKSSLEIAIKENGSERAVSKNDNYYEKRDKYITYQDDDILVSISLFPASIKKSRTLGTTLVGSFIGGCDDSIRRAIKDKGSKYGSLDKPFIVCINSLSGKGISTEDVYNALLGTQRNILFENFNNENQDYSTSSDGLFDNSSLHKYTTVSGFLITRAFPTNTKVAYHWLIKHPHSKNEFDFEKLDLSYIQVQENKIGKVIKKTIGEIII